MLGPGNIVWREGKEYDITPVNANGGYTGVIRKTWTAVCPYFWVIRETGNKVIASYTLTNGRDVWTFDTWEEAAQSALEKMLMQRLRGKI